MNRADWHMRHAADELDRGIHERASSLRHRSPHRGTFAAVVIIFAGTVMLLDSLDIIRSRDFWDYVPLVLVALGVIKMVSSEMKPAGLIFGAVMAGAGMLWFLDNLNVLRFDTRLIWPVLLIGFGISLLIRNIDRERSVKHVPPSTTSSTTTSEAGTTFVQATFFGSSKRVMTDTDFRGGEAMSVFSGMDLDLRTAKIAGNRAEIEATAVFGGIDIHVPMDWNVVLKGVPVFGAYEDKTLHPAAGAPELVITGASVFSGVNIMN